MHFSDMFASAKVDRFFEVNSVLVTMAIPQYLKIETKNMKCYEIPFLPKNTSNYANRLASICENILNNQSLQNTAFVDGT